MFYFLENKIKKIVEVSEYRIIKYMVPEAEVAQKRQFISTDVYIDRVYSVLWRSTTNGIIAM